MPATAKRLLHRFELVAFVLVVAALAVGFAFAGGKDKEDKGETTAQVTPVAAASSSLKRVETKKVCMINNQVFEKDQIPVEVEGRTYYGCCEMCKERLAKDAAARTATDPVTGKTVDKATAVIAAQADGSVLYFESEETLAKYGQ